jgi:hypothetical protein
MQRNGIVVIGLVSALILVGFLLCTEGAVSSGKRYTVMVYLAADNNLGREPPYNFDFLDFDEMEKALVTSGSDLDIVVLWDKLEANDTRLYWVQANDVEGTLATYTQDVNVWYIPAGWAFTYPGGYPQGAGAPSEENMGDDVTLASFLDWVFLNFDSDHYALVLWDHGGGWEPMGPAPSLSETPPPLVMPMEEGTQFQRSLGNRIPIPVGPQNKSLAEVASRGIDERESGVLRGVCWDDTDGEDYLTTKEVATGIAASSRGDVENLVFSACLMQMLEVAYEVRNAADYMTGSEELMWAHGWAYHEILGGITATTTPLDLAQVWATTREVSFFISGVWQPTTSSLDLSQVAALASEVSALADRLSALLSDPLEYSSMMNAKLYALAFGSLFYLTEALYPEFLDLSDFAHWIYSFVDDATARSLAQAVKTQVSNAVVALDYCSFWGADYGRAKGVSIYLPHYHNIMYEGIAHANYNGTNFAFCADHTWDEFVNAFLATDHADPYEPNDTPATAYNLGTIPAGLGSFIQLFHEGDFVDDVAGLADWYKFTTQAPSTVMFWAKCTEWDSDTRVYLYNSLANAEEDDYFAWDDDSEYGYGSYLETDPVPIGTYYLKVESWDVGGGAREDYVLWQAGVEEPLLDTGAVFRVSEVGDVFADADLYGTSVVTGQADVAEWVPVSEPVEPGDLLELDPVNPGAYRRARAACSTLVAGVVSSGPGVVLGSQSSTPGSELSTPDSSLGTLDSRLSTRDSRSALLAVIGIVPVKVTDAGGPIAIGDLLVASSEPGTARRWAEEDGPNCGFIGKALESFDGGTGVIQVLLMR